MSTSATDAVVEGVRQLILTGALVPGSRLPAEGALAEQFGLSRTSVREGVRVLTTTRVLQVRRGDGTYVTSLEPELLLEGVGFAVDMMRDDCTPAVLETRRLIEPEAVALAAQRIRPAELHGVRATLQAMAVASDHAEFVRLDAEFHDLINDASGNPIIAAMIRGVSRPSLRARTWRDILEAGATGRTVVEHERIVAALAAHDASEARQAALDHVRATESWILGFVGADDPSENRPAPRSARAADHESDEER